MGAAGSPSDGGWFPRWAQAVLALLGGRGDPRVGRDGTVTVTPVGPGGPVELHIGDLVCVDPRPARRFLEVFDWGRWLEDPGAVPAAVPAVVSWLAAVAVSDTAAVRVLAGLGPEVTEVLARRPGARTRVTVTLRAVGHTGPRSHPGMVTEPGFHHLPVLWWRRWLGGLVSHPDRFRAVERAEAAWVRVCVGWSRPGPGLRVVP